MVRLRKGPIIEDRIHERLSGDAQKCALEYVAFLRANRFKIEWIEKHNGWNVKKKKASPAFLNVGGGSGDRNAFGIVFNSGDFKGPADDALKEFAWAHVLVCPSGCGGTEICKLSRKCLTVFGKDFKNVCIAPLDFWNLEGRELELAKELLLML